MASSRRVDDRGSDFYLRAIQFARSVRLRNPWGRRVTRNHSEGSGSNLEAAGIDQAQHESEDSSDEDYQPENSDSESENQVHAEEDEGSTCTEERHDDDIHCGILADHDIFLTTKCNVTSSSVYSKIGSVDRYGTVPTLTMLHGREMNVSRLGRWSKAECCHMAARYLPEDSPHIIDYGKSRVYVGRFSADGSLFVGGFQERHIRIYNVDKRWSIKKDIQAKHLRWTVTDTALSHDQRFLVYATLSPIVHLVNVGSENGVSSVANITDIHDSLDFSMEPFGEYSLGFYSVEFSQDGREIVAGCNKNSIYVYDLEANKPTLCIQAHKDDVNTVTYADESCHLMYSGSDDHTCKVWDRRCLTSVTRPAGVLVGHLEGITFIDSRGDGRYFISNGKDQTIKLWDIRKMSSTTTASKAKGQRIPTYSWDYRWMDYPGVGKDHKHPNDHSLMTYRGHRVLRTLIRCYFSPVFTTGQKYIYTGSHDGCVYIFDILTGRRVGLLSYHQSTVRDCSWHPFYPMLLSSSWDGRIVAWDNRHGEEIPDKSHIPPAREEFNIFNLEMYDTDLEM